MRSSTNHTNPTNPTFPNYQNRFRSLHFIRQPIIALVALFFVLPTFKVWAVMPEKNLEQTLRMFNFDVGLINDSIDQEFLFMEQQRLEFWEDMDLMIEQLEKASLGLFSQEQKYAFGLAQNSEFMFRTLSEANSQMDKYSRWEKGQNEAYQRHKQLVKTLAQLDTAHLSTEGRRMLAQSQEYCDNMSEHYAQIQDSINTDKRRLAQIRQNIKTLTEVTSQTYGQVRDRFLFQRGETFPEICLHIDSRMDQLMYEIDRSYKEGGQLDDATNQVGKWSDRTSNISFYLALATLLALLFFVPKENLFRRNFVFCAIGSFFVYRFIGTLVVSWVFSSSNGYMPDMILDMVLYAFICLGMFSLVIRLSGRDLWKATLLYLPFIAMVYLAVSMRTSFVPSTMVEVCAPILWTMIALVNIVLYFLLIRRIKATSKRLATGMLLLVLGLTLLGWMGFAYLSIVLTIFVMNILTMCALLYIILTGLHHYDVLRRKPLLEVSMNKIILPYYMIFALLFSLEGAAKVFNLEEWLKGVLVSPFVSIPQLGIISVSKIIFLVVLALAVNYCIFFIKHYLRGKDQEKYSTGTAAIWISLGSIIAWFLYIVTALLVLDINQSGIIAAIGGASVGIGFAMKDTFENMFYGLSMMTGRVRPGDMVECDGIRGRVVNIGIISTRLETVDGPIVAFPNSQLFLKNFMNLSRNHLVEYHHLFFEIHNTNDFDHVRDIMLEAVQGIDGIISFKPVVVQVKNFVGQNLCVEMKAPVDPNKYLRTVPAIRLAIYNALRAEGIAIADVVMVAPSVDKQD